VSEETKQFVLSFIKSLCLCDHMGDVSDDVSYALRQTGLEIEWDDFHDLFDALNKLGVRGLYD
jgi:hypothetical protein